MKYSVKALKWGVVGPDGKFINFTFDKEDDAIDMAAVLNKSQIKEEKKIAYITFRTPLFGVSGGGTSIPPEILERYDYILLECTYNTKTGKRSYPNLYGIESNKALGMDIKKYNEVYRREIPFSQCTEIKDKEKAKRLKAKAVNVKITW